MQVPRGLINTAFSLSSVASRVENITPKPGLPTTAQNILKYYIQELTDFEKGEVLDYEMIYFLGKSRADKVDGSKANAAVTNPKDHPAVEEKKENPDDS